MARRCKEVCFDSGRGGTGGRGQGTKDKIDEATDHVNDKNNPHETTGDKAAGNCDGVMDGRLGLTDGPHLAILPEEDGDIYLNGSDELCIRSAGKHWRLTSSGWTDT